MARFREGFRRHSRKSLSLPYGLLFFVQMANGNQQRSEQLAASPQLFDSAFLNFFSRVHPSIPAIVFVPVVVVMEWLGADRGLAALELIALTIGGLGIW